MWKYAGQQRPPFAREPADGQESVWDYPRPPCIVADPRQVRVCVGAVELANSQQTFRILETASPPTFYLPLSDVFKERLVAFAGSSFCEWKGAARYWGLEGGAQPLAWSYPEPSAEFAAIGDCVSFFPGRVECYVNGERVRPQPGGFYGGWVTDEIAGPFKGEPGTGHW